MDGARDVLAPRPARVRGHSLPRTRLVYPRVGPPDFEFTVPDDLSSRRLPHATVRGGPTPTTCVLRAAAPRPSARGRVLHRVHLHLPCLRESRARLTDAAYRERVAAWGPRHTPDQHPDYGGPPTTGTATAAASATRPACAPCSRYRTATSPSSTRAALACATTPRHAPARLARDAGIRYDVVTDEDVEAMARPLLAPYATVLTGSHPGTTPRHARRPRGLSRRRGRLVYLAQWLLLAHRHSPALPASSRCDAPRGGIRAWDAQTGEYYHALDGAYGGLWRRHGRPAAADRGGSALGAGLFGLVLSPPARRGRSHAA